MSGTSEDVPRNETRFGFIIQGKLGCSEKVLQISREWVWPVKMMVASPRWRGLAGRFG